MHSQSMCVSPNFLYFLFVTDEEKCFLLLMQEQSIQAKRSQESENWLSGGGQVWRVADLGMAENVSEILWVV